MSLKVLAYPVDPSFPPINIWTDQLPDLMNKRIIVKVHKWDSNSKFPDGFYTGVFGSIGDIETETVNLF